MIVRSEDALGKSVMNTDLKKRWVQRLRWLVWVLIMVVLLVRTEILPRLVTQTPEAVKTLLSYLFLLLWILQGIGIFWAQKLDRQPKESS